MPRIRGQANASSRSSGATPRSGLASTEHGLNRGVDRFLFVALFQQVMDVVLLLDGRIAVANHQLLITAITTSALDVPGNIQDGTAIYLSGRHTSSRR